MEGFFYFKMKKSRTEYHKKYYLDNIEKIKQRHKKYNEKNSKEYRMNHKKEISEANKKYRGKNKIRLTNYINEYFKKRRCNDPIYRLNHSISVGMNRSLNGNKNGYHWEDLAGYTQEDLRKHLEAQFKDGMNWQNYGEWHVDHKIPISLFNITGIKSKGFKKCWALENLQPLWAKENIAKKDKILY